MRVLIPHLAFAGTCEEALNFYKNCFDGKISALNRYKDSPMEVPEEFKHKIMHSEFKAAGITFLAADLMPNQPLSHGNSVQLNINMDDAKEQASIFNKLAVGGTVLMSLQDTFWGARFGMLTDSFGISWMMNCRTE